ncbi:MAG: hypothetical protein IT430_13425 [Phycisphaerales bacterium]|nr:hypothetical protein [Phycisphaerales bacterium]
MEIPPTSQLPGASRTRNRFEDLTSEDFMKIMFTELSNQDPLQPQDTQALLNQINTVRSIESNVQLMDQLTQLVSQNQFAMAGTLVGKTITGLDETFLPVQGRVKSAAVEGNQIVLTLATGERVPMDNIESISETEDPLG